MSETRADHIAWAKARALEYVDRAERGTATDYRRSLQAAVTSICSDLSKHPDTVTLARHLAGRILDKSNDASQVRGWIQELK